MFLGVIKGVVGELKGLLMNSKAIYVVSVQLVEIFRAKSDHTIMKDNYLKLPSGDLYQWVLRDNCHNLRQVPFSCRD
jgi:hypothetical protein